jgi:hypothetical protein
MTEADSVHSTPPINTSPTRRAFLNTIAALPIAAAAPAAAGKTRDAELIALGRQYEALVEKYYAAHRDWSQLLAQAHADQDKEFGPPASWGYQRTAEMNKSWEAKCQGTREADEKLSAIGLEREPIEFAINDLPANSIEGLRAKALVAFFNVSPMSAGDQIYHFGDEVEFQRLFCTVADFVGLSDKVAATGYIMPPLPFLRDCDDDSDDEGEEA